MTIDPGGAASPLPDGAYDVLVVDAEDAGDGQRLDLTVVAGDHKGHVVTVTAPRPLGGAIDLLGLPATLTVSGGVPTVRLDD